MCFRKTNSYLVCGGFIVLKLIFLSISCCIVLGFILYKFLYFMLHLNVSLNCLCRTCWFVIVTLFDAASSLSPCINYSKLGRLVLAPALSDL